MKESLLAAAKPKPKCRPVTAEREDVKRLLSGLAIPLFFEAAVQPIRYPGIPLGESDFITFSGPYSNLHRADTYFYGFGNSQQAVCPYGRPGDLLWLKEGWATRDFGDEHPSIERRKHYTIYEADSDGSWDDGHYHDYGEAWQAATEMPQWACRLVVQIESIQLVRASLQSPWTWKLTVKPF